MITTIAILLLGGATVTLPIEGRVHGTEITLGEVATVSGLTGAERLELEQVLPKSPPAGAAPSAASASTRCSASDLRTPM